MSSEIAGPLRTLPQRIVQPVSRPLTKRRRTIWWVRGAMWEFHTRAAALAWQRDYERHHNEWKKRVTNAMKERTR